MKILLVNKYLFPKGGAETYLLKLGAYLSEKGHEVQYFGMDHPTRCVGNRIGAYTREMEFHQKNVLCKLSYLPRVIYSEEARRKMTAVLEDFQPDVVHFNNIHFQLTPSILVAAERYRKKSRRTVRLVMTAHDYQLICPNHMLYRPASKELCQRCFQGQFWHCMAGRCIHRSFLRSVLGMLDGYYWNRLGIYDTLDAIICPSAFLKEQLDCHPVFAGKTVLLHNFIERFPQEKVTKEDYVLYFGRYSEEKGIGTLIQACRSLPDISFVFAGSGPMEGELEGIPNIHNVGFLSGQALKEVIQKARFSVYPSEWYENCPFSVIESQICGTPVLGANIGGIPELIRDGETGRLFEAGNVTALTDSIWRMWQDRDWIERSRQACLETAFVWMETYYHRLMKVYQPTEEVE